MANSAEKEYNVWLKEIQKVMGRTTTSTNELNLAGSALLGRQYRGAWPSDQIPKLKSGQVAIANLDNSQQPGSHWVALAQSGGQLIVYDSFGRKSKKILPAVYKGGKLAIDTELDIEQGKPQKNCGQRCLAALAVFKMYGGESFMKL